MSDAEKHASPRSSCAREVKPRKFVDFCVRSDDLKTSRPSSAIRDFFHRYMTFDNVAIVFASISLACSYFLVLIPNMLFIILGEEVNPILSHSILAPFLSIYKSYCTFTLDPFICKIKPGWMYAPLLVESFIQVPILKVYLYCFKHPERLSIQHKRVGFLGYGLVILVKTLPILCEVKFNPNIQNKLVLYSIYGTDLFVSCSLAVASMYERYTATKASTN